jgi:hypothetical protein
VSSESFIEIRLCPQNPKRKTQTWFVFPKHATYPLGRIYWWSAWRCYCFVPEGRTVYEQKCLREIADFCEAQTNARKAARSKTQS